MAKLLLVHGPLAGRQFPLTDRPLILGRQPGVDIVLDAAEVSRQHARAYAENGHYYIEDLGSSNGTFLNSVAVDHRTELHEQDQIKIGPYLFLFEISAAPATDVVIQAEVTAHVSNRNLFKLEPGRKLQAILELSQQLARTLDLDELLPRLLDQLLRLFLQADRGLILLVDGGHLVVRALRSRREDRAGGPTYSRSVVARVLEEGVGIVAADAGMDQRFQATQTINALGIRSFVCVPFKTREGQVLGVLQLDRFGVGAPFTEEDLNMLTAIALHVSVVLENVALHADLLRQERLKRDLALAREIQEGFLPRDFGGIAERGVDLFAQVYPARDVSGDFYDFFPLDDQRIGFIIADVSGKGIPAALFMIAVRSLGRHLAMRGPSPAAVLQMLNDTLAADNAAGLFVTMTLGIYHPATGEVIMSCGGHPPALHRQSNGHAAALSLTPGRVLGFSHGKVPLTDTRFTLRPAETLVLYTDGVTEALAPDGKTMFGTERLIETVRALPANQPLEVWSGALKATIDQFTQAGDLYDDITLLLLRRPEHHGTQP